MLKISFDRVRGAGSFSAQSSGMKWAGQSGPGTESRLARLARKINVSKYKNIINIYFLGDFCIEFPYLYDRSIGYITSTSVFFKRFH